MKKEELINRVSGDKISLFILYMMHTYHSLFIEIILFLYIFFYSKHYRSFPHSLGPLVRTLPPFGPSFISSHMQYVPHAQVSLDPFFIFIHCGSVI